MRGDKEMREFAKTLAQTHPDTDLKVGDIVTFTNEYGVTFHDKVITGFWHSGIGEQLHDRIVYLAKDSWWFPVSVASLKRKDIPTPQPTLKDWS